MSPPPPKPTNRARRFALLLAAGALVALGVCFSTSRTPLPAKPVNSSRPVLARGRIEPVDRVRTLQGPSGEILARVLVCEGDTVAAGAIVAETRQHATREAELAMEERRLDEVTWRLTQVSGPASQAEIAEREALVQMRSTELEQLRRELERTLALASRSLIATETQETKRADVEKAEHALVQARSAWRSLTETREVDAKIAAAQVEVQKHVVSRARAELELTRVRAPISGEILLLNTREGEALDSDGLLQMADLSTLIIVAEVDEAMIGRVRPGQRATLSGPAQPTAITGTVTRLAKTVYKQSRPTSDILIGRDARIVEVEIRPDTPLPPVIGAEVTVTLEPASAPAP